VSDPLRYGRQMMLPEIGDAGQAKLARAVVALGGEGLSHEIAASYAERAGVGQVVAGPIDEAALAPSFLRHAATRAVVSGARAALSALRGALEP
jgi:hypothetical protein